MTMRITLDLTDEQLQHLKALQEDFAYQQAHDQAEYPTIYVLVDFKTVVVNPDSESGAVRYFCDPYMNAYEIPQDDLPSHLADCYPDELAAFRAAHPDFDWGTEEALEVLLEEFPDLSVTYLALRPVDAQTFLTRQSADTHLQANRYHYHAKAFIERRKMWRNPVMQSLVWMLYHIPLEGGAEA